MLSVLAGVTLLARDHLCVSPVVTLAIVVLVIGAALTTSLLASRTEG